MTCEELRPAPTTAEREFLSDCDCLEVRLMLLRVGRRRYSLLFDALYPAHFDLFVGVAEVCVCARARAPLAAAARERVRTVVVWGWRLCRVQTW